MNREPKKYSELEEILKLIGSPKPFGKRGTLTSSGRVAYDKLKYILNMVFDITNDPNKNRVISALDIMSSGIKL